MKKNTVLLSVERYNALRDFKKNIEEGKKYVISYSLGKFGRSDISYHTDSEIVDAFNDKNKALDDELNESISQLEIKALDNEFNELTSQLKIKALDNDLNELIFQLKKMGWIEFRKFKRGLYFNS